MSYPVWIIVVTCEDATQHRFVIADMSSNHAIAALFSDYEPELRALADTHGDIVALTCHESPVFTKDEITPDAHEPTGLYTVTTCNADGKEYDRALFFQEDEAQRYIENLSVWERRWARIFPLDYNGTLLLINELPLTGKAGKEHNK